MSFDALRPVMLAAGLRLSESMKLLEDEALQRHVRILALIPPSLTAEASVEMRQLVLGTTKDVLCSVGRLAFVVCGIEGGLEDPYDLTDLSRALSVHRAGLCWMDRAFLAGILAIIMNISELEESLLSETPTFSDIEQLLVMAVMAVSNYALQLGLQTCRVAE
jgi:hypothetical protein